MGNVTSSSAKDAVTEVLIPKVEEYSNGTLKIVHFPDNQLGNDEQSFAMAQTGECDIAVGSTSSVATTYNDLYVYDVPYLFLNKQEVYDVGFNGRDRQGHPGRLLRVRPEGPGLLGERLPQHHHH